MSRKVSLKDIAREAGVSTALVSYVLNNLKEGRIRREVAQRVREIAERLNYRPNQVARSLKTRKTFTIGLIVADISNPFSSTLARIIEDEADHLKYTVLFGSSDENPDKFSKVMETLLNRQVDGLIISPPENAEPQLEELNRQEIPFVLLDRYYPTIRSNYVVLNNFDAARQSTNHLINSGCSRPAYIGYHSKLVHLQQRHEGYLAALRDKGIYPQKQWEKKVDIVNNPEEILKMLDELLKLPEPPDGILFASNVIAGHCLRKINTMPLRVPQDLAIVCFDESASLELFYSPVSFVRQPLHEMGKTALQLLIDAIGGKRSITQVELEAELVVRESSIRNNPG